MTRGRCGSLILHRMTLSFTTPRRFNRRTRSLRLRPYVLLTVLARSCFESRDSEAPERKQDWARLTARSGQAMRLYLILDVPFSSFYLQKHLGLDENTLFCCHKHRGFRRPILCYQQHRGFFLRFAIFSRPFPVGRCTQAPMESSTANLRHVHKAILRFPRLSASVSRLLTRYTSRHTECQPKSKGPSSRWAARTCRIMRGAKHKPLRVGHQPVLLSYLGLAHNRHKRQ